VIRHAALKIDRDSRTHAASVPWAGFGARLLHLLGNPKAVIVHASALLPGSLESLRSVTAVDVGCDHRVSRS